MAGCRPWSVVAVAFVLVATLVSRRSEAQTQIDVERPARIVVAPASFQVFGPVEEIASNSELTGIFRDGATRFVHRHDAIFESVTTRDLKRRVKAQSAYGDKLEVANRWAELGIENYKKLRTDEAIEQLDKALEQYRDLDYSLVAPGRVAEVSMYLALSYLNRESNAARPLVLMKRMIRLDPTRALRRGFYPDDVVNFFETARQKVVEEFETSGASEARAERLADLADADLVLFAQVLPEGGGYEAHVQIYSRRAESFVAEETTAVELDGEALSRAANETVSRSATCVYHRTDTGRETVVESAGRSPWSATLGFVYGSFLRQPNRLRSQFGNLGLQFGGRVSLTEEFGIELEAQFLNAQRDYDGFLVRDFNTLRAILGADLGIQLGRFDIGTRAGFEAARIGSVAICRDKQYLPGCDDVGNRETWDARWAPGVGVRPRVRFRVVDAFRLTGGGNLTYLFVPPDAPELNSLLTGEFGIQYRF